MATNADNAELAAGPAVTPTPAMMASAVKFKAAWEGAIRRSAEGDRLGPGQIIEMQEAFLGLIWATETTNVEEALEVLRGGEPEADGVTHPEPERPGQSHM